MDPARRAFYRYHASLMEPWDGPAAWPSPTARVIGAVLDRNGLRPARYWVTDDGLVVLASEVGVFDIDARPSVVRRVGCSPGGCSWSTPPQGRIVDDEEIKASLAAEHPYDEWLARGPRSDLDDLPAPRACSPPARPRRRPPAALRLHQRGARLIVARWPGPAPSRSARWAPTRLWPCSRTRPRLLFDYFTQLFAQVTNPPLDAIREELVTSLSATVGPERNLLDPRRSLPPDRAALPGDRQRRSGEAALRQRGRRDARLQGLRRRRALRRSTGGGAGAWRPAHSRSSVPRCRAAIAEGANIIVLSDRNSRPSWRPSLRCC